MRHNRVPSSPEANGFTEVFSWEHVVKVAEEVLVNSSEYENAQRAMQPYWKKLGQYIGGAVITTGMAIACIPPPFGSFITLKDHQQQ